ncbi:hypothetical protein KJ359_009398 [Pestalotiopsis sp. 9143b]|nr:hypothetical protein KJ359_009398 [Pestalotiopsis sp. 9143b]
MDEIEEVVSEFSLSSPLDPFCGPPSLAPDSELWRRDMAEEKFVAMSQALGNVNKGNLKNAFPNIVIIDYGGSMIDGDDAPGSTRRGRGSLGGSHVGANLPGL